MGWEGGCQAAVLRVLGLIFAAIRVASSKDHPVPCLH
jgi:hypothetical protein